MPIAAAVLLLLLACGDKGSKDNRQDAATATIDAGMTVTKPGPSEQPATIEGLKQQLTELATALDRGEELSISAHSAALVLPDAQVWFRERFSARTSRRVWNNYEKIANNMGQVSELIAKLRADGLGEPIVARYQKVDDLDAVVYQTKALKAMKITDPLYSVRYTSPDKQVFHLWSFVHVGGNFRYIGKMSEISKARKVGTYDLNEYRATDADAIRKLAEKPQ